MSDHVISSLYFEVYSFIDGVVRVVSSSHCACLIVWIPYNDITACLNCWGSGYKAKEKNWLHIVILSHGDLSVDECVRTQINSVSIIWLIFVLIFLKQYYIFYIFSVYVTVSNYKKKGLLRLIYASLPVWTYDTITRSCW